MSDVLQPVPDSESNLSIQDLIADFSIEATPRQIIESGDFGGFLPGGTSVYVPFLPGAALAETAAACRRLKGAGLRAVPHLAARAMASVAELDAGLARLADSGVDSVLLIAGDAARPAGAFASTMEVLETDLLQRHGFRHVGFAGHPEGHPAVAESVLDAALADKVAYARASDMEAWLVTQFVFDAAPVTRWLERVPVKGLDVPVRIGIPGPAKLRTLLQFAIKCGIATSARALSRRPETARLLFGQWTPDNLLADLADYRQRRAGGPLAGVHIFAFGGVAAAAQWMRTLQNDGDMVQR